ncbi:MAG: Trk system potassium transporter TrkA [Ruminococcus sp.]|nr:Trk system potassium transporter TrkA [Ruminococcus sp.]MBQ2470895.1 Trk system potassium transporter TrkA [Ruminococcus sp.]MBQ4170486.1 Trk system potassium transporter TrkA [Ruminococcus sp.]MBQ4261042.1 Trk system potassium transporter TrkA [Ruminococcus sp.]SCX04642.1 trk system potassium uptake protein TrkA [Ruminococcaceae bacterium P7]
MKIVIVGCGKVGTSIASELNLAGHNIVVIDINRAAVTRLSDSIDGMGIEGNGATYETLSEAGAGDADLVIAVTARDEVNLYTCLMARTCGCPNTIARVRNPEYTNDLFRVKDILGLSMFINPELTAAVEISRLLRFSGALEIDSFSKGMFELIKVGVPKNSPLVDRAISRIDILRGKVRICTVERDNEVYIPNGEFVIRAGDRISIASKPEIAAKFFKKAELNIARSRDVMILGGGKISYYLAQRLLKAGVNVKIIEKNAQRCEELSEMLHDAVIIHGDCMDQDLLLSEGVEHTDGVAALMDYDEENILISMYIKNISKAKAITKVNNAHFDSIIDQIDLECVINPKKIAGEYIARYVRAVQNSLGSNVETLYRLHEDRVEALEFRAKSGSRVLNKPLAELSLKDDLQIICIARKGRIILPVGSDMILPDDSVVIITKHKGLSDLNDILR